MPRRPQLTDEQKAQVAKFNMSLNHGIITANIQV
jgi:hypothetical protein